jgi:predicted ATPase
VHLHPRAQAELGTLLATVVAGTFGPQCLVETHSDYLVDRVAMAVRDPKHPLGPDDVSLLFFQPRGAQVTIHPLRFDARGNVVDAPPEYRSFFLHEHARFLGLDDEDDA